MWNKSKTQTVTTKTSIKSTSSHVQKIVSSSYLRSNGTSEITQYKSMTTGTKSSSSGSSIIAMRSIERFGKSTDALQRSPFEQEFGSRREFQGLSRQNNTDARMISGPSQITSTYSQNRPEPGVYRSPYRTNTSPQFSTGASKTFTAYNPPSAYNRITTSNTFAPVSTLGTSLTKPIFKSTSTKPVKTILVNSQPKSAERAVAIEVPKLVAPKGRSKLGPGDVYIFNQEKFDNEKETREGTKKDVETLKRTFQGCFKMNTKVCNDFRVKDIQAEIAKIEKKDFSKKACIVFVILTHGTRHDIVSAKDDTYSIDDVILFPILKNKTLGDKPKIFIIQACKGDNATNQFVYTDAKSPTLYAPLEIAKLYSTFEGFLSYRGEDGSLFIQILCENLQKDGKTKSVIAIMEYTISQIVKQYKNRQVPTITHNMTQPLVFGDYV